LIYPVPYSSLPGTRPPEGSWGGLFNTYYWLDPARKVTGLIMTQVLPFADPRVLKLYGRFESSVYEVLKTG
jgi:CubicO group peptidase (beta-lactamase class C family)